MAHSHLRTSPARSRAARAADQSGLVSGTAQVKEAVVCLTTEASHTCPQAGHAPVSRHGPRTALLTTKHKVQIKKKVLKGWHTSYRPDNFQT
jgi:hypothetical protein